MGADERAAVVEELVAHHDDVVDDAGGVHDAVPGAERLPAPDHVVDAVDHLRAIGRMLMRQHQFGGGGDGAGLVAVHPLHLVGPHPAFALEVEAEPAHPLRGGAGQAPLQRRGLPV
ncbi:hypothetical protein MAHJHV29_14690 [Mycobacterium avium subsp. hominissuis]